jgi:hypothetical protein
MEVFVEDERKKDNINIEREGKDSFHFFFHSPFKFYSDIMRILYFFHKEIKYLVYTYKEKL